MVFITVETYYTITAVSAWDPAYINKHLAQLLAAISNSLLITRRPLNHSKKHIWSFYHHWLLTCCIPTFNIIAKFVQITTILMLDILVCWTVRVQIPNRCLSCSSSTIIVKISHNECFSNSQMYPLSKYNTEKPSSYWNTSERTEMWMHYLSFV